jgi:heptosyltransferase-3
MQRESNVVVLQSTLPCVPCGRAGCENHRQSRSDCLIDISAQRVLTHVNTLLAPRDTPAVPAGEADRQCT